MSTTIKPRARCSQDVYKRKKKKKNLPSSKKVSSSFSTPHSRNTKSGPKATATLTTNTRRRPTAIKPTTQPRQGIKPANMCIIKHYVWHCNQGENCPYFDRRTRRLRRWAELWTGKTATCCGRHPTSTRCRDCPYVVEGDITTTYKDETCDF
ncbi:hypothetical protein B0H66DRAFT_396430 [Apodospora peruviana]|uniref:Uncharacterized protein n=1 Tax=Apodospora peruviana TaxID=516989 RepID=A0AAE0LYG3_9PEZI|nr:hypothetical protein B0H66DRAFT_396430 [Apodospora peruviana]